MYTKIININFPADTEGLWTYIYYSYSDYKAKAGNIEVASHVMTHQSHLELNKEHS